jgi:hypothetical protein
VEEVELLNWEEVEVVELLNWEEAEEAELLKMAEGVRMKLVEVAVEERLIEVEVAEQGHSISVMVVERGHYWPVEVEAEERLRQEVVVVVHWMLVTEEVLKPLGEVVEQELASLEQAKGHGQVYVEVVVRLMQGGEVEEVHHLMGQAEKQQQGEEVQDERH